MYEPCRGRGGARAAVALQTQRSETRVVLTWEFVPNREGFLYVCTLLLPFERKLISIFERACPFENASRPKGGRGREAHTLRVKRELMEVRSLYYIARGFSMFALCRCPSNVAFPF